MGEYKKREPKSGDQEKTVEAIDLVCRLTKLNPHIEGAMWIGAFWAIMVRSFINSGLTYKMFCKELNNIKKGYKNGIGEVRWPDE